MGGNNRNCYPISAAIIATFLMKWAQDFTSSLFDVSFSPVVQWGVVLGVLCVLIPSQATPGRLSAAQQRMGCACTPLLWWGLVAGRDKHLPLGPRLAWGREEEKKIWLGASSILPNSDKRKQVTKLPNLRKWCFRLPEVEKRKRRFDWVLPLYCPTLTKGSKWQSSQIWESDVLDWT